MKYFRLEIIVSVAIFVVFAALIAFMFHVAPLRNLPCEVDAKGTCLYIKPATPLKDSQVCYLRLNTNSGAQTGKCAWAIDAFNPDGERHP